MNRWDAADEQKHVKITAEKLNFDATGRELKSSVRFPNVNITEDHAKGHITTLPLHSNAPQYKHRQVTQTQKLPQHFPDSGARGFQYIRNTTPSRAGAVKSNGAKINLE